MIIEQDGADRGTSKRSRTALTRRACGPLLLGVAALVVGVVIGLLVRGQTTVPSSLRLISVIDVPAISSMAADESSRRLYLLRAEGRSIFAVDLDRPDIVQQIPLVPALTVKPPTPVLAVDEQAGLLYVASLGSGLVSRVDLATGQMTSAAVGRAIAIAVDPRSHRVYAADLGFQSARDADRRPGNVWALDASDLRPTLFVPSPGHLTQMVLDPANRRLVALGLDPIAGEYVQIIELDSAVEQRVRVPPARFIALDRSGESVYLASGDAVWTLDLRTHALQQLHVVGSTGEVMLLVPAVGAHQFVMSEKRGNVATISLYEVDQSSGTATLRATADLADVPRAGFARDVRLFVLDPHDGRVLVFAAQ